jgi:hypothetical protein
LTPANYWCILNKSAGKINKNIGADKNVQKHRRIQKPWRRQNIGTYKNLGVDKTLRMKNIGAQKK